MMGIVFVIIFGATYVVGVLRFVNTDTASTFRERWHD